MTHVCIALTCVRVRAYTYHAGYIAAGCVSLYTSPRARIDTVHGLLDKSFVDLSFIIRQGDMYDTIPRMSISFNDRIAHNRHRSTSLNPQDAVFYRGGLAARQPLLSLAPGSTGRNHFGDPQLQKFSAYELSDHYRLSGGRVFLSNSQRRSYAFSGISRTPM